MRLTPLAFLRTGSLAAVIVSAASLPAQGSNIPGLQQSGPVIESTGMSVGVPDANFTVPDGHVFKAVWVIDAGDTVRVNQQLTTIARYFNVHARHGFTGDRVQAAAVVHGSGWLALLSDSAFAARYGGKTNPSRRLVEELLRQGTQLVLCGQTAGFRGVRREELLPGVKLGISAMTALNVFQAQGFQYNPW
jgi:intracellular sulfur oxidation DsrE/DsrF family protein